MLNHPFDGSKIQITRVRVADYWGGNAVHFRYEGQIYRASIREDPDSEDESGNRVRYAHLQIADVNGNWGKDIAARDFEDEIPIHIQDFANIRGTHRGSVPYKFYDTEALADYLNSVFIA